MAGITLWVAALLGIAAPNQAGKLPSMAVPVLTQAGPDMFPHHWKAAQIAARAESLEAREIGRSVEAVRGAMDKYPLWLVKRNLRRVFVVRTLQFYGLDYGGTNSLDTLYLANSGRTNGFTDRFLEESFHHEFSSVLLRNYAGRLDRSAWAGANAPRTRYIGNGTEAVRQGASGLDYGARWHEMGFLCEYGAASLEEDFNTYAEGLFAGGRRFWRVVDAYPRVRAKARIAVRFYQALDASFNEDTFRAYAELLVTKTEGELR